MESPIVAEWYDGKDDPKMALVRFDIDDAKIWLSDLERLPQARLQQAVRPQARSGHEGKGRGGQL